MEEKVVYNTIQIQELLPHRYPFLLIDKIVEYTDNHQIVAIKNVTINEPFFQGHFPGRPVMPGVLVLEAMAQASAVLARISTDGIPNDKAIFLCGADDVRWKRQVVPGDTLRIVMTFVKKKRPLWIMDGKVYIDGALCCAGVITAAEV